MDISNLKPETYKKLDELLDFLFENETISGDELLKLCNGNIRNASMLASIIEEMGLVKVHRIEGEYDVSMIIRNAKLLVFREGGGFFDRYFKKQIDGLISQLINEHGDRIPLSKTLFNEETKQNWSGEIRYALSQKGYLPDPIQFEDEDEPVYHNPTDFRRIEKELKSVDEITQNELINILKRSKKEQYDFLEFLQKALNFKQVKYGAVIAYQRSDLPVRIIFDKLDALTETENDRSSGSLLAIEAALQKIEGRSGIRTKLSYNELDKELDGLLKKLMGETFSNKNITGSQNSTESSRETIVENDTNANDGVKGSTDDNSSYQQAFYRFSHRPFTPIDRSIPPCFNITEITEVLADHLNNLGKEKGGQMVGVFGKWGRGKTYFVDELLKTLKKDNAEQFIFIPFQAWKYQDTPAIWAYLYESLSKRYLGKKEIIRFYKKIYLNIRSEGWGLLTDSILIGLLWAAVTCLLSLLSANGNGIINDILNIFNNNEGKIIIGGTIITLLVKFFKDNGQNAIDLLKKYSKEISFSKHLGAQAEVEKELVNLLTTWIGKKSKKRIILFVDDIDRCSEDKIIQLVDALRVMLEHEEITKRVIVLVAIDEEKLKMAISYKYRQLLPNVSAVCDEIQKLTGEYMDKLFISGIKLQPLNIHEINEFAATLVKENWKDETVKIKKKYEQDQTIDININSDMVVFPNDTLSGIISNDQDAIKQTLKNDDNKMEDIVLSQLNAENETKLIQDVLSKFAKELTPRQVRIFYYRFQLAKNLYFKLAKPEEDQIITTDLNDLLLAIQLKTERSVKKVNDTDLIE